MKKFAVFATALLCIGLGLGACKSKSSGPETLGIQVDAKATDTGVAFTQYFPSAVTVHPGDTVDFSEVFSGEPHTVTFGTLVDQGLAKSKPTDPTEPPELAKIPLLLPQGPGDANQAAAQPCFLATGDPPASAACAKAQQTQPAFDGTQTYYNSGFLTDGEHYKVTLADAIKPGTYNFFCALHRAGMTGKVVVVAKGDKADKAADVQTRQQTQIAKAQADMKPTIDAIRNGTLPGFLDTASPTTAIAGGGNPKFPAAVPTLFGPATLSIKVGDTVSWTVVGPHTIAFNASEAVRTFLTKAPDGSVHANPQVGAPTGGAGAPPGPPPTKPTTIDGGSFDGTGYHSSGAMIAFPPTTYIYKLKFTKAGSFSYFCQIHPDMKGTVNVT